MLGLNGEVAGSQEQGDIGIIIGHWNVVRATICEKNSTCSQYPTHHAAAPGADNSMLLLESLLQLFQAPFFHSDLESTVLDIIAIASHSMPYGTYVACLSASRGTRMQECTTTSILRIFLTLAVHPLRYPLQCH